MTITGQNGMKAAAGVLKWWSATVCALGLAACGSSTPTVSSLDTTPPDFYDGARILQDVHLVDLAAQNPLFDIMDGRGVHFGTLALMAGEPALERLDDCATDIPGPMANCSPRGVRVVNGRLNMGVVEFGGETGLYHIGPQAVCFSQMSTITGCHQLGIRYDSTIEVKTPDDSINFWILR